jgi:Glycosyltransferase 61
LKLDSLKYIALKGFKLSQFIVMRLPSIGRFQPLRGEFSAYELLRQNQIDGEVILERQDPGVCMAGSMTELALFEQNDHQPWPIFWTKAKNALLVGKLLHWRDDRDRICLEGIYNSVSKGSFLKDEWSGQLLHAQPENLPGAWTSLLSNWNDGKNYYHWILDGLTRLAVRDLLPEPTTILIPSNSPKFVTDSLRLLGLEDQTFIAPNHPVRLERYYFCSPTSMTGVWNPFGYHWIREKFSHIYAEPESGPPIFMTRRSATRVPGNLDEIEKLFRSAGFSIIDCGELSISEQIIALSGAPAVAGLHGAAMTNLLWVRKDTPVLELFQPNFLNACYEQIAIHGGLDYEFSILAGDEDCLMIHEWLTRRCLIR